MADGHVCGEPIADTAAALLDHELMLRPRASPCGKNDYTQPTMDRRSVRGSENLLARGSGFGAVRGVRRDGAAEVGDRGVDLQQIVIAERHAMLERREAHDR